MREPSFLVLTALVDEPRHGYGVIAEVGSITHGRVRLRPGTLYAALDRLSADGIVVRGALRPRGGNLLNAHGVGRFQTELLSI